MTLYEVLVTVYLPNVKSSKDAKTRAEKVLEKEPRLGFGYSWKIEGIREVKKEE